MCLEEIIESLNLDGYAVSRSALNANAVAKLILELEIVINELQNNSAGNITGYNSHRKLTDVALRSSLYKKVAASQPIVGPALKYFNESVRLHTSTVWLKPGKTGQAKPPHQDAPHWNHIQPPLFFTSWLALDKTSIDNGCLWYQKGSHKLGPLHHVRTNEFQIIDFDKNTSNAIPMLLEPGDIAYHIGDTVHWSEPNKTTTQRRGVAFCFFPDSSRIVDLSMRDSFDLIDSTLLMESIF